MALICLEFYTQLAAQFGLLLVINSSRGLKLLQAMLGTALYKLPAAAGEIGVGYHFNLAVRFGGQTFVVRGFGTKHPCWWWNLLRILALYRAQVATYVHWPLRIWHTGFRALLWAGTAAPDSAADYSASLLCAAAVQGRDASRSRASLRRIPPCIPRHIPPPRARVR